MQKTPENNVIADFIGEQIQTDEERAAFERKVAKLLAQSDLLNALEEIREAEHVTKAEVARRIGTPPSVVSRLLSGRAANPTLGTLLDVADALGVYLDIRIKPQPKRSERHSPIEVQQMATRSTSAEDERQSEPLVPA